MKHVTFTRDMRPYRAGEMRLVSDEIAATLEAQGDIAPNPPSWPAEEKLPGAARAHAPAPRPPRGRYLTKRLTSI